MLVESIKRSIWRFTFFASVMFVQCSHQELFGENKLTTFGARNLASAGETSAGRNKRATIEYEYLMNGETPFEYLRGADGFLAGEDTPVWLAHTNKGRPVYNKLPDGYVKRAINWWESKQPNKAYGNLTGAKISPFRGLYDTRFPSVLAVLDYDIPFPTKPDKQDKWIYDRIVYALAFWNGVDLQLRIIKNPSVRIRLVGIVISRTRDTFPYIYKNEDIGGLDAEIALVPMMSYWKSIEIDYPDFSKSSYDTVATITQAKRRGRYDPTWSEPTAADTRSPCLGWNVEINGVIVHDARDFSGLQPAVHSIARTLGAQRWGLCNVEHTVMEPALGTQYAGYGRRWSACTLEQIGTHLAKYNSCMTEPYNEHEPGRPVKSILPGMLMSVKDVCQLHVKPNYAPYDCFKHMKNSPCGKIICAEDTWKYSPCKGIGIIVMDGSKCDGGFDASGKKICLDGECVNNPGI